MSSSNQTIMAELQKNSATLTQSKLLDAIHKLDLNDGYYQNYLREIRDHWMSLGKKLQMNGKAGILPRNGRSPQKPEQNSNAFTQEDLSRAGCEIFLNSVGARKPISSSAREALVDDVTLFAYCEKKKEESLDYPRDLHAAFWNCFVKFPTDKPFLHHGIVFSNWLLNLLEFFNQTSFDRMVEHCETLSNNIETEPLFQVVMDSCVLPYIEKYQNQVERILVQLMENAGQTHSVLKFIAEQRPQYQTKLFQSVWENFYKATDATDTMLLTAWRNLSNFIIEHKTLDPGQSLKAMQQVLDALELKPDTQKLWVTLMQSCYVPLFKSLNPGFMFRDARKKRFITALKSDPLANPPMSALKWVVMEYDVDDIHWLFTDINLGMAAKLKGPRGEKWRQFFKDVSALNSQQGRYIEDYLNEFDKVYVLDQLKYWQECETDEEKVAYFDSAFYPNLQRANGNLSVDEKARCLGAMCQAKNVQNFERLIALFCAAGETAISLQEKYFLWKQHRQLDGRTEQATTLLLNMNDVTQLAKMFILAENPSIDDIRLLLDQRPQSLVELSADPTLSLRDIKVLADAANREGKIPVDEEFNALDDRLIRIFLLQRVEPVDSTRANHTTTLNEFNLLQLACDPATRPRSKNAKALQTFLLKNAIVTKAWLDAMIEVDNESLVQNIERVCPWMKAVTYVNPQGDRVVNKSMLEKMCSDPRYTSYAKLVHRDVELSPYQKELKSLREYANGLRNAFTFHWNRHHAKALRQFLRETEDKVQEDQKTPEALKQRLDEWKLDRDLRRPGKEELGSLGRRLDYFDKECEAICSK